MNAVIQFVQWTIKQTRLLYADLGITEHQDSAKIARFVERFRHADWITAKQVRSWIPAKQKPSCDECREFMGKIVAMGYATIGKGTRIMGKYLRNPRSDAVEDLQP